MTTTLGFKPKIDPPLWRPASPLIGATAAGGSLAYDMRNDASALPLIFFLRSALFLDVYNTITDEWMSLASPGLTGTFGAGATAVMHPSQGPRGTLAAGWSATVGALTTALPVAIGTNQLADRGDGVGHRIRIIGKSGGGAGKINERTITANTLGLTPTITLDAALDWSPASGDGYEILAGRVFMLSAAALAAGQWKYYDIATNSYSGNLATTNLPATIATDSSAVALSELHVSSDRAPGSGFINGGATYDPNPSTGYTAKNCILATAADSTHITGSGMPADLQANEYVNFQIRIVEDVTNPTGVGQRAKITAHGAGATGQFTVGSWPVITPSATAKFVVENNDDQILLRSSAQALIYTYNLGGNAWDTTTFGAPGAVGGAGYVFEQCFGIVRDPTHNRRHSHIFCFRGGAGNVLDMLDIANGANGTWSNAITYGNQSQTLTTGTSAAYDPVTLGGKYLHINVNGTQRFARFNMLTGTMETGTYLRYLQGVALVGQKLAMNYAIDGSTKLGLLYVAITTGTPMFSQAIQG